MLRPVRCSLRKLLTVSAALALTLVAAACGSPSPSTTTTASPTAVSHQTSAVVSGIKQTGSGLTKPTAPAGARIKGGTVYLAETPGSTPNYIFPMYAPQYCSSTNIDELQGMLYRPLYWYGNNYKPTVDYDYSIGRKPLFSDGDKTVTIHLNHYLWSDGENVTSRDIVFWMNVLKADPATEWCGYVPGKFPDNVVSYSAPNASTFVMHLNRAYNPTWFLYNELSQIVPLPLAWDKTSLTAPTPSAQTANLPDTSEPGARAVYKLLSAQGADTAAWTSSRLWKIVDGPFRLAGFTQDGQVTLAPNPHYSGSPKPQISELVELPFANAAGLDHEISADGSSALTISSLPAQGTPSAATIRAQGYTVNQASSYSINFFPLNLNNPKVGPVFRQRYFRQALQHLVDQDKWISQYLGGAAVPTDGASPSAPPSALAGVAQAAGDRYQFSVTDARALLAANGWKVVPGGASYCAKPGTGHGHCGSGIKRHEQITFNLDYRSGDPGLASEMSDLAAQARRAGIRIKLTTHSFKEVYGRAVPCISAQAACDWSAENWGSGWSYSPDYYPTGEDLFGSSSLANYSNYASAEMDKLITATLTATSATEATKMARYLAYAQQQLPVVFVPTQLGSFAPGAGTLVSNELGGYAANALGFLNPEDWYLVK